MLVCTAGVQCDAHGTTYADGIGAAICRVETVESFLHGEVTRQRVGCQIVEIIDRRETT